MNDKAVAFGFSRKIDEMIRAVERIGMLSALMIDILAHHFTTMFLSSYFGSAASTSSILARSPCSWLILANSTLPASFSTKVEGYEVSFLASQRKPY